MRTARLLLFFILFFAGIIAQAQKSIGLTYGAGRIFKHTKKIYHDAPPFSQNFELSYTIQTTGKQAWERRFGLPQYSISLLYNDYRDPVLKGSLAFLPTMQVDVIKYKALSFSWRMGYGVALAFDHWTRADTLNNYLGSAVNMFALLQPSLNLKCSKNLSAKAGVSLSHTSNGGAKQPNYGINLLTANVGLFYALPNQKIPNEKYVLHDTAYWFLDTRFGLAYSETLKPDGPMYANYNFTICAGRILNNKHKLFLGLDANYSKKNEYYLISSFTSYNNLMLASSNLAICGGDELLIGRFGLPLQLGYYVYNPVVYATSMYQKIGLNYYLLKNQNHKVRDVYIGSLMKSHKFNADYVEFYLGLRF